MSTLNVQSSCGDANEQGSLSVEHALQNMLNAVSAIGGSEQIHLRDAIDRVLAEAITSPVNVPSHRNSAVDGYAMMQADLPVSDTIISLNIIGRVVAGHPYKGKLKAGDCIQIMTGAQMPNLADTVIMQEHVEVDGNAIRIDARHSAGQNVRQAGEDIELGQ
ncbi:MAG TPA: molybdopterin molybdenumtransferase MoeA, partial [Cycloclasticus sp.]|nr:molybdopterin molybdenumtransferase MoeA [Cycloclasticus sp.]